MNLEQIQEMWEKDSKIDPDNLHDESLKIPQLHSKYYTLYNTITLMREKARDQRAKIKLERYNYYTGKADPKVYEEEPFPYKVREKDAIQRHLDADERLTKIDLKIRYLCINPNPSVNMTAPKVWDMILGVTRHCGANLS